MSRLISRFMIDSELFCRMSLPESGQSPHSRYIYTDDAIEINTDVLLRVQMDLGYLEDLHILWGSGERIDLSQFCHKLDRFVEQ